MARTYRGDANLTARELGRAGQPGMSAHDLLDDDHNRVLQLFNDYAAKDPPRAPRRRTGS
jgi:hypothetical protein